MKCAIVGASGLLGQTLAKFISAEHYNSKNIESLQSDLDCIYVCAPSAVKWWANQNPDADFESVQKLAAIVNAARPKKIIHFSTIDVYGSAQLNMFRHELTIPEPDSAYGKHRFWLECAWESKAEIYRLPGLYGKGLKKNVIFDIKNKTESVANICPDSEFQWFNLAKLENILKPENFRMYIESERKSVRNITERSIVNSEILEHFPDICVGGSSVTKYKLLSIFGHVSDKEENLKTIIEFIKQK